MSKPVPLKRADSIANLQKFAEKQFEANLENLTDEQRQEIRKNVTVGALLQNKKGLNAIAAVRHARQAAAVEDAVREAAAETAEARKQAELEKRMAEFGPQIADAIQMAKVWANEAPKHIDMIKDIAVQIERLAAKEFVTVSSSGGRVLQSAATLRKDAQHLIDHEVYQLLKAAYRDLQAAEQAKDVVKLQKLVDRIPADARDLAAKYYALGMTGKEAVDAAITMMDEKAIKAWVGENPDTAAKLLDAALTAVGTGLDIAEEAMSDSPAKEFTPILSAFNILYDVVIKRQAKAYDAYRQVRKKQSKGVKGQGFTLVDEDTTLMAKEVARQQKANFDAVLRAVSFLGSEIPGWIIISTVIKQAAHKFYDERVELAKEAAGKSTAKTWEDVEEMAFDKLKDAALTDLPEVLASAAQKGVADAIAGGSGELAEKALDLVVGRIMKEIMKHLPIKPGQLVDGDSLRGEVQGLMGAVKIRRHGQPEEVEGVGKTKVECPTEDSNSRPVEKVMQQAPENDSAGLFFWVKIDGQIGKLHVEGKVFKPISGSELTFPEKDKRDRVIDEVLMPYTSSSHPGATLQVRMGDLVGIYFSDGRFEPTGPATVANWSGRAVNIDGYQEGGAKVTGTWFRCPDTRYLYLEHGNKREWAEIDSRTANGFNFAELFEHSKVKETAIAGLEPVR